MAKIGKRILGAAGVGILVASIGALAACSGGDKGSEGTPEQAKAALTNANVKITLLDKNGIAVGTGTGTLIAPNTVLTAGHLVAGYASWKVESADGKIVANGKRGLTRDWMVYNSMKTHPRKLDVGVIYLDRAIKLAAYPKLGASRQADGIALQRVSHTNKGFEMMSGTLSHFSTFPHAYVTDIPTNETLDTGGAVINDKGEIIGVSMGRGIQTGKLHIARIDEAVKWLSPKVVCGGGGASLTVKTYGTPPPADCDGGDASTTSSSSSSSGGDDTTGDDTTSSSSSSSGGGDNPGDNPGDNCTDTSGNCSGNDCPPGSNPPDDSTSSSSSSSSGGETPPSNNTSSGGGLSSGNPDDTTSSSSSSGGGPEDTTSSSSSSGGPDNTGGGDKCQGPGDNPETCPPEPTGCADPSCGGGTPDSTMDYGGARTNNTGSGPGVIH